MIKDLWHLEGCLNLYIPTCIILEQVALLSRLASYFSNRKTFSLLTIPIIEQRKVRNAISWIIIKLGIPCAPECYLSNQRSFQRKSACGEVECYVAENAAKDEYLKDIDGMDVGSYTCGKWTNFIIWLSYCMGMMY